MVVNRKKADVQYMYMYSLVNMYMCIFSVEDNTSTYIRGSLIIHVHVHVHACVLYVCIYCCRYTTIPSRTKGKRKVQIKLRNCRALQSSDKVAVPVTVGARGGGGGESRVNEDTAVEKYMKIIKLTLYTLYGV